MENICHNIGEIIMIGNKRFTQIVALLTLIAFAFTLIFALSPASLGITAASSQPEYASKMFDKSSVLEIEITADESDWQTMLDTAIEEEYIAADITIDGETFYNVGIRPKGNSSLSSVYSDDTTDRFSFKIKSDEYVDGQKFYGLSEFVLNNMQSDATYMKEFMSYEMMEEMGIATPLYSYASITLNGEPWGLYLAIEAVEEEFAERNFGTEYGQMYKPDSMEMGAGNGGNMGEKPEGMGERPEGMGDWTEEMGERPEKPTNAETTGPAALVPEESEAAPSENNVSSDAVISDTTAPDATAPVAADGSTRPTGGKGMGGGMGGESLGADLVYSDDEYDSYSNIFDGAVFNTTSDSDKTRLISSLKQLSLGENIEEIVDVDSVLRYFAANVALVNLDSYLTNMTHNYYLYEDDGQLSMIPWDYNLSFGAFQAGNADSAVNYSIDEITSGVELAERPIIAKLMENESYKLTYQKYLADIASGYMQSDTFAARVTELDALISSYVEKDATAFYTYDEYKAGIEMLKQFTALRAESILLQIHTSGASVDASSINMQTMGQQGGGKGGDKAK